MVVPTLTVTACGPKAKLWIVTAFEATGAAAPWPAGAGEGIPGMLEGIAVGSSVGDAVPAKPASPCPLAGLIAAPAEVLPPLAHPASSTMPAAVAAVTGAHQHRFQRR